MSEMESIRKYLKDEEVSQRQLAASLGISEEHLSRIISRQRGASLSLLRKIAKQTGISIDQLAKESRPDGRAH